MQENAERIGQRRLQAARCERCNGGVARLDLGGRRGDVVDRVRRRHLAFGEYVGAVVEKRSFDVERNSGKDAVERRRLDERRAEIVETVIRRDVFLHQRHQVRIPAGRRELLSLARGQRHEDVDLVAVGVHHRQQALAHLLLLVGVHLQLHAGQFLEVVLVFQDRRRPGIVVGEERDGFALVGLPVEIRCIGRYRRRTGERQRKAQHSRPAGSGNSISGCR